MLDFKEPLLSFLKVEKVQQKTTIKITKLI